MITLTMNSSGPFSSTSQLFMTCSVIASTGHLSEFSISCKSFSVETLGSISSREPEMMLREPGSVTESWSGVSSTSWMPNMYFAVSETFSAIHDSIAR